MAIQNIRIKYVVDTGDIDKADKSLDKLTASEKELKNEFDKVNKSAKNSFDTIEKGSDNVNNTVKKIASTIGAAFAVSKVIDFGKEIINIRGEFQKLEAVLSNTLGSNSKAKAALNDIKTFAATTNFSVLELTDSFVKLANRGFVPTIEELGNLGDLANSTGKSFDQLTEAILDAQSGEFERLKEFGIRASKQGDQVKFAFKGVKTEVEFTQDAIKDYLVGLGDLNGVQGSTEAISKTLSGQVSNLGDSYDQLFDTIGRGTGGVLSGLISTIDELIKGTTELLKTNEQLGEEQALRFESAQKAYIAEFNQQKILSNFLIGKDNEYKNVFINNRTEQQSADFKAYQKSIEGKKLAAEATVKYFQFEVESNNAFTRGKSIAETNKIKEDSKNKLALAKEYYDQILYLEKEQADKSNVVDQKNLDKQYDIELRILAQKEALAKREAELLKKDKVELLKIELEYNQKRVDLFKQYNQADLQELASYNLTFKELANEKLEYLRGQENKYNDILSADAQAKYEIEKEYLDSVESARQAEFDAEIDRQLRLAETEENQRKESEKLAKESAERRREIANALVNGIQDIYNTFNQNQQIATQNEINANNYARNQELKNAEGNKQAQANINAKYDQIEKKLKLEQAKADKEAAIFNIGIAIATAVARALPNIPLAAIVGGLGAIQLGLVASRPLPKFAKGVERLEGEGTETSDSIIAKLSKGERVVTAQENKDYFPALHAIHNRHVPPELLNGFVMNYDAIQRPNVVVIGSDNSGMERELKSVSRKLDNLKQVNVNIDKSGVHAFLSTQNSNTEIANNYIEL